MDLINFAEDIVFTKISVNFNLFGNQLSYLFDGDDIYLNDRFGVTSQDALIDRMSTIIASEGTPEACKKIDKKYSIWAKDYENWIACGGSKIIPMQAYSNLEFAEKLKDVEFERHSPADEYKEECLKILNTKKIDELNSRIYDFIDHEKNEDGEYSFKGDTLKSHHNDLLWSVYVILFSKGSTEEMKNFLEIFKDQELNIDPYFVKDAEMWNFIPKPKVNMLPEFAFTKPDECQKIIHNQFYPLAVHQFRNCNEECAKIILGSGIKVLGIEEYWCTDEEDDQKCKEDIKMLLRCGLRQKFLIEDVDEELFKDYVKSGDYLVPPNLHI